MISLPNQKSYKAVDFFRDLYEVQQQICVTTREQTSFNLSEGLHETIRVIRDCAKESKKLIFIGNGGSAGIASHQALDYWKNGKIKAVAFNDASLLSGISNDYGNNRVFAEPIKQFAEFGDILLAISSSGRSKNILEAVDAARELRCHVITLSGFDSANPLRSMGDLNFYVPSYSYGQVEVAHLCILHSMLDEIIWSSLPSNGKR